jgi:hypothetical protein
MVTQSEWDRLMATGAGQLERARQGALASSAAGAEASRRALEEGPQLMSAIVSIYMSWRARFRTLRQGLQADARRVGETCRDLEEAVELKLWQMRVAKLVLWARLLLLSEAVFFVALAVLVIVAWELVFPGELGVALERLTRNLGGW